MTLPPRRLLDSPPEASEDASLLVDHLRAVSRPPPLSAAAVERISRRLSAIPVTPALPSRKLLWGLVIGASLALAAVWPWTDGRQTAEKVRVEPVVVSPEAEPAPVEALVVSPTLEAAVVPPPAEPKRRTLSSNPAVRSAPKPTARAEPVVVPTEPLPQEPDPLIEESRLLQAALHQLRNIRDGQAALAVLDRYEQRFPQGQLWAEATLARVDSLLLLARPDEALARLQRLSSVDRARLPRSRELKVLEVELLAEVGRCDQALTQLERLPRGEPQLEERALFVHATCEARAQRNDRARALYEELLRRWPEGAHAAQARRAVGKSP
ncbi:MAG: hypothetical protein M3Y59_19850 [Myxococcota bacterium]|nr:hypothetical protein [Myxococcota bacterium]